MRVGDFLEIDLLGVDFLHAAVFNRVDVVVEHLAAIGFEFANDFVQAVFVEVADKRQAEGDAATVLAAKLVVLQHFIAPSLHLLLDQRNVDAHAWYPRCDSLQIRPAFIDLEGHQRGVVVGAFKGGVQVLRFQLAFRQGHGFGAAVGLHQRAPGGQGGGVDHGEDGVFVDREAVSKFTLVIGGDAPLDGGDQEGVDCTANRLSRLAAKAQRSTVAVKQRDVVHPIDGRFEREGQRGDDAVGAVGVVYFLDVGIFKFNQAWRFFQRDDADHRDVARVFQNAVANAARTGVPTCDKAANGGDVAGAGEHEDLLSARDHRAGAHGGFEISDQHARFAGDVPRRDGQDTVQRGDVQNHPAV